MDLYLVMKSCRDDGQFETSTDGFEKHGKAFRFFSPHHHIKGTVKVLDNTICVSFDEPLIQKQLFSTFSDLLENPDFNTGGNSLIIKNLASSHAFWEKVHQISKDIPPPISLKPEPPTLPANLKIPDFDPEHDNIAKTEEERMQKIRLGQDYYRKCQELLWGNKCAVTGISIRSLLRASHAIPWKDCQSGAERLNPYNGFLLSVGLDALFDADLISFDNTGKILLNPTLPLDELARIGIHAELKTRFIKPEHLPYLAAQRKRFEKKCKEDSKT